MRDHQGLRAFQQADQSAQRIYESRQCFRDTNCFVWSRNCDVQRYRCHRT